MIHQKFTYECNDCGTQYLPGEVDYLCPACSSKNHENHPPKGVLKTIYNYRSLLEQGMDFSKLKQKDFLDLLPVQSIDSFPKLRIGQTPLYRIQELNHSKLPFNLFLKDDAQNPTFSFKDRASGIVSAYAKEKAYNTLVCASTGNAGSSISGICAAQNQKAVVLVPESAPLAKLTQILMYGAQLIPVKGNYDDAFMLSIMASEEFGWYNRNTAYNPLTIEGKKTVAFELFEQFHFNIPDRIFVPVGDGVILSGVYKGFEDLLRLNLIQKMPLIVAVQSSNSDNLVRNIDRSNFEIKASCTLADSISVNIPSNFYMAQKYIQKYKGEYISVSDQEILEAAVTLSKNTGLFTEPASAAAFAGMLHYQNIGKTDLNSNNVVLLTGSGLKDLKSIGSILKMPEAIKPELKYLKKYLA